MTFHIIIRGKNTFGTCRAEHEENFRKDGMRTLDDKTFDKAKWIKKRTGYKGFLPANVIDNTDMVDGTSSKERK